MTDSALTGLSRGITAVKQCPLVARWASTRLGRGCGWRLAGSEKLSGLDILMVACIGKTTRETLKKLALGEGYGGDCSLFVGLVTTAGR